METVSVSDSYSKSVRQDSSNANVGLPPEQLSFDELMDIEDQTARLALIPYTNYHLLNAKEFSFPQRRFFILSVIVHIIFAGYALTIIVEKLKKPEVIEVSYVSPKMMTAVSLEPTQSSFNQPEPPAVEEPAQEAIKVKPVAKAKAVAKSNSKNSSKSAKVIPVVVAAKSSTIKTNSIKAASTSKAEPMATVSDIEVPDLTAISVEESAKPSLKEIETDFDKIDKVQNEKLLADTKTDSKMLADSMSDLDKATNELADEHSDVEDLAAERLKHLQEQKSQIKKAAKASSGPAIHKAALASNANSNGFQDQASENQGGAAGVGSQSEGIVRRLEDLRQRPGNPRPDYDVNDRMNGLSGTIVINAYVTKEGSLTLFRLIQSTGHRNLDRKTLSALKNWKFYPGQEGWVELPFKWDLKGGVQQKPTLLKRR